MSIDKVERFICDDCGVADHCYVCPCCEVYEDDDGHDERHPHWIEGCNDCIDRAEWIEFHR